MDMLKNFLGAASALTLALAWTPAIAQTAPAAPAVDADPALWVVKDADTTIYLFGTVHLLKPGVSWFDDGVKAAFDKSDELVMELADPTGPETMAAIAKYGALPAGPALSERLSPKQRETYAAALAKFGMQPAMLDRQQPWIAALTLSMLPLMKDGYNPTSGPEMVLLPAAKAAGKQVKGLESAEEQIGLFAKMPEAEQIAALTLTAEQVDNVAPQMNKMVASWSKGDTDGIARFMADSPGNTPEAMKTVFYDRNARWAEWIDKRMDQPGTVFIAVGAGHLAGGESVQAKLGAYKLVATRVAY
jgi:uncharacterized protein